MYASQVCLTYSRSLTFTNLQEATCTGQVSMNSVDNNYRFTFEKLVSMIIKLYNEEIESAES